MLLLAQRRRQAGNPSSKLGAIAALILLLTVAPLGATSERGQGDSKAFEGAWSFKGFTEPQAPTISPDPNNRSITTRTPAAPSFGDKFVAKIQSNALVVERSFGQTQVVTTYKLDGSESRNQEGPAVTVSRTVWKDGRLVIVTTLASDPKAENELKRVLWIDKDGSLFVETTSGTKVQTSIYKRSVVTY